MMMDEDTGQTCVSNTTQIRGLLRSTQSFEWLCSGKALKVAVVIICMLATKIAAMPKAIPVWHCINQTGRVVY